MRFLFVSSTIEGGSGRSQRELAKLLIERGHDVWFLVDDGRRAPLVRWAYEQLSDIAVRWANGPGASFVRSLEKTPGRATESLTIDGIRHEVTPIPENAFEGVITNCRPDVVVGNSVIRLAWRKLRAECALRGIATVLYVRELTTFPHLEAMDDPADALVANAMSLARGARDRGHDCAFVPSVVDVGATLTDSSRRVALLINPIPTHGVELLWEIAGQLPEIPFVLQESWPLSPEQIAIIEQSCAARNNVDFVRSAPPGPGLYSEARVLLVPHRIDNRPRVVLEAQANGIPVVASDQPGLRELVGPAGILLPPEDADRWSTEVSRLWKDQAYYEDLSNQARTRAQRSEIQPAQLVERFLEVVDRARMRSLQQRAG